MSSKKKGRPGGVQGGQLVQMRYARGSRASRVCARTSTHPRPHPRTKKVTPFQNSPVSTGIPAGPVRTLAGLQGRCARLLPGDPCAQLILLTRIAVPVQWRCRQSEVARRCMEGCPGHQGAFSCCNYPRGVWTLVRERHVARGRG